MQNLPDKVASFLNENEGETLNLIKALCQIPAPSRKEQARANFVKNYLDSVGAKGVFIDDALNVIYPVNVTSSNDIVVFLAHTDTVFADETPMPYSNDGEYIYSPGVCDNTVCLAQMLTLCKYVTKNNLNSNVGVLFVANSCEEGLGNLKGVKKVFESYGKRIVTAYSFDGQYDALVTKCVGSHRYEINVKTQGGHSFNAFGNLSAISVISKLINDLYSVKVPSVDGSKTTYNVGVISGGTSVNTIAESCTALYEYRSDNENCLAIMEQNFNECLQKHVNESGATITVKKVGDRPCSALNNLTLFNQIVTRIKTITEKYSGEKCNLTSGSTDCNVPMSLGVPAVCVGTHKGYGAHTRDEKLLISSVKKGLYIVAETILYYFNN